MSTHTIAPRSAPREVLKPSITIGRRAVIPLLSLALAACGRTQAGREAGSSSKLPFGIIDAPVQNQTVKGSATFFGWAIGDDGISRVAVFADRVFVKDAVLGVSRPDVANVHPGLKNNDTSGWTVDVDVSKLGAGSHEIVIQAFTPGGSVRELGTRTIVVTP